MSATMNETDIYKGMVEDYLGENVSRNTSFMDPKSPLNKSLNIATIFILFVTMISLGCTMDLSKIKSHFMKPKGVAIAIVSQFGIMPLTAFCLAKILRFNSIKAVTVLICGCCPGGSLSNIFTLAMQGDMNLSIVMTTCSSIAALGLMPLLLFLYCQGFPGLENAVPYVSIIITLTLTVVPCAIGIAITRFKPKYTRIVVKVGISIMICTCITIIILSSFAIKDKLWMIMLPDVLAAACLLPLIGFMMGYVMSIICRLGHQCSRTIALETGFQNIQLCTTILKVAFPPHVIGPMFLFPLLYFAFQLLEGLLLTLCFRCYRKFKPPAEEKITCIPDKAEQEEVKTLQGQRNSEPGNQTA